MHWCILVTLQRRSYKGLISCFFYKWKNTWNTLFLNSGLKKENWESAIIIIRYLLFSIQLSKKDLKWGKRLNFFLFLSFTWNFFSQEVSALTPMDMRSSLWFSIKSLLGIFLDIRHKRLKIRMNDFFIKKLFSEILKMFFFNYAIILQNF